ncbi:hypothetical protein BAC1_00081 [uncultured bacterium]|nr:hypothetical protein BAC1_00081 [uncultured bacterium]
MAELPYLKSYKNVGKLFERIKSAKTPEIFNNTYLYNTLGLKSNTDRPLIALLKSLGFLDSTGKPTPRYSSLKNEKIAKQEIAQGIRQAYEPLFTSNENAETLNSQDLKGLVAQIAGTDIGITSKIVGTFKALAALADFSTKAPEDKQKKTGTATENEQKGIEGAPKEKVGPFRPDFHYNIQVHLPLNGTEETYLNIFNALRKVFG